MSASFSYGLFTKITLVLLVAVFSSAEAVVPTSFTYQGRLTNSAGTPLNEIVALTFNIYSDSLGATSIWTEALPMVPVTDGLFSVELGKTNPLTAVIFNGNMRWLGIRVDLDPELRPLRQLLSIPNSFQALHADTAHHAKTIADNSVTTGKIVNGTISFSDIGQNAASNGQVMKWNGSSWAAAADVQGSNASGWVDNGTAVSLINLSDTVALNTSSRLGKLNLSGDIGLTGESSIYFGSAAARLEALPGNDMKWVGADLSLLATESVYFVEYGVDTWAEFDNVNRRVGIGTINPADRLHLENDAAGTCWLRIQGSHPTQWGQTGLRIQTPANTWHLRQDLYTHANFPEGALSLYSSAMSEEAMTWLENGNVGIGTANPTRKLHVDGSIQIDDTLYAGAIKPSLMAASRLPDEPGFASNWFFSPTITITSDPHTVLTAEIVVPASGYVLAIGFCEFQVDHTWGDIDHVYASIAEDTTSSWIATNFGFHDDVESGNFTVTASPNGVFRVDGAGSHTFHLLGSKWGPATTKSARASLVLIYSPSYYGTFKSSQTSTGSENHPDLGSSDHSTGVMTGAAATLTDQINALRSEVEALKAQIAAAKR